MALMNTENLKMVEKRVPDTGTLFFDLIARDGGQTIYNF